MAGKDGELARVREAEEPVQARLAASLSAVTRQANEIADKERQLAGLREAQQHLRASMDSSRCVLESCARQDAELQQLRCSGEALREVER